MTIRNARSFASPEEALKYWEKEIEKAEKMIDREYKDYIKVCNGKIREIRDAIRKEEYIKRGNKNAKDTR